MDARWMVLLLLGLAACGSTEAPNGTTPCSDTGECPSGYSCALDRHCWQEGTGPRADAGLPASEDLAVPGGRDMAVLPDLVYVMPANQCVWSGSGGGSATAASGNSLNLSVGGTVLYGSATSSGGAVMSYGYFSMDTF